MKEKNYEIVSEDGLAVIEGSSEYIIYSNEENGYTILELITDKNELITAVGVMPYIGEGENLKLYGKWVHNPKYGRQFSVSSYEKVMPADEVSILRYLASGVIKGIGPKTAQKIVDLYGKDTFDVIENHCEWLAEISGITPKKAREIGENFKKSAGMRSTMMFFREFFGAALTMKIYKRFGAKSVELAKANPYILCEEIDGIGFEKADNMARSLGFSFEALDRIASGIVYMMKYKIAANGHVCLPENVVIKNASKLLEVSEENVMVALSHLLSENKIVYVKRGSIRYIYEKESYDTEKYIARKLDMLDKLCASVNVTDMHAFILKEERRSGMVYAPLQKKAISASLESGIMILTGGPGTGKTTVVRALIRIFESMGLDVALAAPTGRAANRMSEATGCEAKTIHRLLEMDFTDNIYGKFNRDENNLLDENVIIVDEASMIDQNLMCALLKAIKPGARLIIIGDSDQLPSVGAGNILRDLIDSQRFSTIRLNEIFRQASESLIVTNAHAINNGQMPNLTVKDKDFFYLARGNSNEIAYTVADLCKNRLPKAYGVRATANMQVISPSRKGEAGTENLNVLLQETLNPAQFGKKEYKYKQIVFRQGDRVMQTKNNYDLEWQKDDGTKGNGIFNGDIGSVYDIDFKEQYMEIVFDDKSVKYDFSYLEELEHAYAITVHKSQGSEYPIVIIPAYRAPEMLLTRNMLYTAVTRAQNMVVIVGDRDVIATMVENDRQSLRYTGLSHILVGE